ncbi:MAG: phosphodiester glycosidase family protein, partial [Bacteroidota bacterium]
IQSLDTIQSGYGNFYLQPNGVFYIKDKKAGVLPTTQFRSENIQPDLATQSGPMLLINGNIHPVFKKGSKHLNIRNGVGIISDHEIVFAISTEEVNLFDFALFFKEKWQCENALYLDGFVSKAYIPTIPRHDLGGNFGVLIGIAQ